MKELKEIRFLFPAVKSLFANKKVRNLVSHNLFVTLVIALLVSMVAEMFIYQAAAKVTDLYTAGFVSFK